MNINKETNPALKTGVTRVLSGFTLAEVLITMGIIGIVAAMTMPALIANYQKKVVVSKLKKVSSTLTQGCRMALADDEVSDFSETALYSAMSSREHSNVNSLISKYYKVSGAVEYSNEESYQAIKDSFMRSNSSTHLYKFNLADGTNIEFNGNSYIVNLNPAKKNPFIGIDIFYILLGPTCTLPDFNSEDYWPCAHTRNWGHPLAIQNCFAEIVHDGWEIKYDFNTFKKIQTNTPAGSYRNP